MPSAQKVEQVHGLRRISLLTNGRQHQIHPLLTTSSRLVFRMRKLIIPAIRSAWNLPAASRRQTANPYHPTLCTTSLGSFCTISPDEHRYGDMGMQVPGQRMQEHNSEVGPPAHRAGCSSPPAGRTWVALHIRRCSATNLLTH